MSQSDLAKLLAALGHDTRLGILKLLLQSGSGLVAGEIAKLLIEKKSTLSSHLAILVSAELIFGQREGRNIRYRVNTTNLDAVLSKLAQRWKQGNLI